MSGIVSRHFFPYNNFEIGSSKKTSAKTGAVHITVVSCLGLLFFRSAQMLNSFRKLTRSFLAATNTLAAARSARDYVKKAANRSKDYDSRVKSEIATFANDHSVHDLPGIFHYWSNKFLVPKIQPFGFIHPDDFFVKQLVNVINRIPASTYRFISVGAGNCDAEVRIAQNLCALGYENFVIECFDLNEKMLQRGLLLAQINGCSSQILPVKGDFNHWNPRKTYHAVIANQSLHHVLNLEKLFDSIYSSIASTSGALIISDMIGRNGHQRWPEALSIVEEIWKTLPERYKFNHQLKRVENSFVNWDCSTDGFEGIRAQDILPLLVQRFHFELFVPFANIISPFIDRSFGHNFNVNDETDRLLIDSIHARDEEEMIRGNIKPTQMFAVLCTCACETKHPKDFSPVQSIRHP